MSKMSKKQNALQTESAAPIDGTVERANAVEKKISRQARRVRLEGGARRRL